MEECTESPIVKKRFLFFKWNEHLPHKWKTCRVGVHMVGVSDTFIVERNCEYCDKWERNHFVEHNELLAMGFKKHEIKVFLETQI